jgi:hypothetical protein
MPCIFNGHPVFLLRLQRIEIGPGAVHKKIVLADDDLGGNPDLRNLTDHFQSHQLPVKHRDGFLHFLQGVWMRRKKTAGRRLPGAAVLCWDSFQSSFLSIFSIMIFLILDHTVPQPVNFSNL